MKSMKCNICGEEKRCFMLIEAGPPRPPIAILNTAFFLCSDCLSNLVVPIKTEKTSLPSLPPIVKKVKEIK